MYKYMEKQIISAKTLDKLADKIADKVADQINVPMGRVSDSPRVMQKAPPGWNGVVRRQYGNNDSRNWSSMDALSRGGRKSRKSKKSKSKSKKSKKSRKTRRS